MLISLILLLFFMLMQGLFAGMETGMISVRRPRIEHACESGSRSAKLVLFFLNNPGVMISTTLLGVNISVVCASLAAKSFAEGAGLSSAGALLAMSCALSVGMLICEIIPKNWFRQAPCLRCSMFIWVLYATYFILFIPARLFDKFTSFLSRKISKDSTNDEAKTAVMREDLKLFLMESESSGGLPAETASILDNAIDFHSSRVSDIMKKKQDITEVSAELSVKEAMQICKRTLISKLPVFDPVQGRWTGIFSSYHAMFTLREKNWDSVKVKDCMQQVISIDENTPVVEALSRTRGSDVAMYIVEKDGTQTGAFTSFDIARKLFG